MKQCSIIRNFCGVIMQLHPLSSALVCIVCFMCCTLYVISKWMHKYVLSFTQLIIIDFYIWQQIWQTFWKLTVKMYLTTTSIPAEHLSQMLNPSTSFIWRTCSKCDSFLRLWRQVAAIWHKYTATGKAMASQISTLTCCDFHMSVGTCKWPNKLMKACLVNDYCQAYKTMCISGSSMVVILLFL